jgi:predicted dehydrogenase
MTPMERTGTNGRLTIGLLGLDASMAGVASAAIDAGDVIAVGFDLPADASIPPAVAASVRRSASWEPLLDDTCDAVLVAADGWSDARGEVVRSLVQAGRTLLVSQPLALSMLWAYELDMIRTDSGARIIPALPDRLHPFVTRLREQVEEAVADGHRLGSLETITMERRMGDRSREPVLRQLARDADLVRVLVGEPQRLATLGGTLDTAWPTLAVEFTGERQVPVRWNVARGEPTTLTIALVHGGGSTIVTIPDHAAPWTWRDEPEGPAAVSPPFDPSRVMLAQLHRLVRRPLDATPSSSLPPADWADAARAVELADTVPRSLLKGRAIDLHQEEFSEIGTFKGTMASLGCGIVLLALLVLVLAALVGGIAREAGWAAGERIAGAWPMVVLAALVLFLVLQILPLLVGDSPDPGGRPAPDPPLASDDTDRP